MSGGWLIPIAGAALLGSLHCIGMCGGLVAVASHGAADLTTRAKVQLAYQAARLLSYTLLGAAAGTLGRGLDLAGEAAGIGKTAAIVAGGSMAAWGMLSMLAAVGLRLRVPRLLLPSGLAAWLGKLQQRPPLVRAALLGGSSALLPCGFLYAFVLAGAATGSALSGAAVMAALWLGNLPALLGLGFALGGVLPKLRRHVPLLSASAIFLIGFLTLNSRTNLPAFAARVTLQHLPGFENAPTPGQLIPADCHSQVQEP
jgi:sulfite exporter TauE/SafE